MIFTDIVYKRACVSRGLRHSIVRTRHTLSERVVELPVFSFYRSSPRPKNGASCKHTRSRALISVYQVLPSLSNLGPPGFLETLSPKFFYYKNETHKEARRTTDLCFASSFSERYFYLKFDRA